MDSPTNTSPSSPDAIGTPSALTESPSASNASVAAIRRILDLVLSSDPDSQLKAAKEIRRLTKTSHRCRRQLSPSIPTLVSMLSAPDVKDFRESALLALLNLAVKDDENKICIVQDGALGPIISFLRSKIVSLQENAAAMLLTLSASSVNKPVISASGPIPNLVEILRHGSLQAKMDAARALSNLIAVGNNLNILLETRPIPSIVNLLKSCKKSSKAAEKCCSLLESLVSFDECRTALIAEDGGVFSVVDVLENGKLPAREHSVATLLTMCQSDRCKYREPILREGVIPGLLEMTVQGTAKSQQKAHNLLRLLRDTPYPRSEFQPDTLENIVSGIISQIDGDDQCSKAKQMLAEMVQVSMEQSLRHLQRRALVCNSSDLPIGSCVSEVPSK